MADDFPDFVKGVLLVDQTVFPVPAPDFPDWTDGITVVTQSIPAGADFPDWTKVVAEVQAVAPPNPSSSLVGWWDATQLTGIADGSNVTTWPDESGNGHNNDQVVGTTPTYARYGIGNLPSIHSAAGGYGETTSWATPTAGTCAGVFQVTNSLSGICGGQLNIWEIGLRSGNWEMSWFDGAVVQKITTPAVNPAAPHAFVIQWDNGGHTAALWIDGVLEASSSSYIASNTFTTIVQLSAAPNIGTLTGQIGEVLLYGQVLSPTDVGSVFNYLAGKWGVG